MTTPISLSSFVQLHLKHWEKRLECVWIDLCHFYFDFKTLKEQV